MESTKTRQDAFSRVIQARIGSLADQPTDAYLASLREFIYGWLSDVETAIAKKNITDGYVDVSLGRGPFADD